ncbi:MAG: hypothetical protein WBV94_09690 [Blastocatellia bacterium]
MATDIKKFNSIKDVDRDDIFSRSKDGKTFVLRDGTKVSDALIKEAKTADQAKSAAVSAATASKIDLNDPEFVNKVSAIAMEAAQTVINQALAKK